MDNTVEAERLLFSLRRRGVKIRLNESGAIELKSDKVELKTEEVEKIRALKSQIVEHLSQIQARKARSTEDEEDDAPSSPPIRDNVGYERVPGTSILVPHGVFLPDVSGTIYDPDKLAESKAARDRQLPRHIQNRRAVAATTEKRRPWGTFFKYRDLLDQELDAIARYERGDAIFDYGTYMLTRAKARFHQTELDRMEQLQ